MNNENLIVLENVRFDQYEDEVCIIEIVNGSRLEVSDWFITTDDIKKDFYIGCKDYLSRRIKVLYLVGKESSTFISKKSGLRYY